MLLSNYISSFFSAGCCSLLKSGCALRYGFSSVRRRPSSIPKTAIRCRSSTVSAGSWSCRTMRPQRASSCVACGICQMNCPNGSIKVISETVTDEEGKKKRVLYQIRVRHRKLPLLPALRAHLPARSDRVRQQVRACGLHARQTGASAQSRRFNVRKKIDGNGNYLATGRFCVSRRGDRRLFGDDGDHEADSA